MHFLRCGRDSFEPARGMDAQRSELSESRMQTRDDAFDLAFCIGICRAFMQTARLCQSVERLQQYLINFRRRYAPLALAEAGLSSGLLGMTESCFCVQGHNTVRVKIQVLTLNLGQLTAATTGVLTLSHFHKRTGVDGSASQHFRDNENEDGSAETTSEQQIQNRKTNRAKHNDRNHKISFREQFPRLLCKYYVNIGSRAVG